LTDYKRDRENAKAALNISQRNQEVVQNINQLFP